MPLIEVGRRAPDFVLLDQHSKLRRLTEFARRPIVLFFQPHGGTALCTREACRFRDLLGAFRAFRAVVIGLSPQPVASIRRFADAHDLGFTLLADPPGKHGVPAVCAAYGVWTDEPGAGPGRAAFTRTTFLIDPAGFIVGRWEPSPGTSHADLALAALASLSELAPPRPGRQPPTPPAAPGWARTPADRAVPSPPHPAPVAMV